MDGLHPRARRSAEDGLALVEKIRSLSGEGPAAADDAFVEACRRAKGELQAMYEESGAALIAVLDREEEARGWRWSSAPPPPAFAAAASARLLDAVEPSDPDRDPDPDPAPAPALSRLFRPSVQIGSGAEVPRTSPAPLASPAQRTAPALRTLTAPRTSPAPQTAPAALTAPAPRTSPALRALRALRTPSADAASSSTPPPPPAPTPTTPTPPPTPTPPLTEPSTAVAAAPLKHAAKDGGAERLAGAVTPETEAAEWPFLTMFDAAAASRPAAQDRPMRGAPQSGQRGVPPTSNEPTQPSDAAAAASPIAGSSGSAGAVGGASSKKGSKGSAVVTVPEPRPSAVVHFPVGAGRASPPQSAEQENGQVDAVGMEGEDRAAAEPAGGGGNAATTPAAAGRDEKAAAAAAAAAAEAAATAKASAAAEGAAAAADAAAAAEAAKAVAAAEAAAVAAAAETAATSQAAAAAEEAAAEQEASLLVKLKEGEEEEMLEREPLLRAPEEPAWRKPHPARAIGLPPEPPPGDPPGLDRATAKLALSAPLRAPRGEVTAVDRVACDGGVWALVAAAGGGDGGATLAAALAEQQRLRGVGPAG